MTRTQRPTFTSLVKFAAEARGEEWAENLGDALAVAMFAGWTWERTFLVTARMIVDDDATPQDLLDAVGDPGKTPCPPTTEWAVARAALGHHGNRSIA